MRLGMHMQPEWVQRWQATSRIPSLVPCLAHACAGLLPHSGAVAAGGAVPGARAAAAAAAAEGDPLTIELSDVVAARRCADPSLPEGEALWVGLGSRPLVGGGRRAGKRAACTCRHAAGTFAVHTAAEAAQRVLCSMPPSAWPDRFAPHMLSPPACRASTWWLTVQTL